MVKGVVSPRPLAPNLVEDSAPSFRPAAAVTPYAAAGVSAAGASAPAGFGGYSTVFAHDAHDRQCDLGHGRHLTRFVLPDLDRVVRPGTVLRVQHQQVRDVGLLATGIDLPRGTPQYCAYQFHPIFSSCEIWTCGISAFTR